MYGITVTQFLIYSIHQPCRLTDGRGDDGQEPVRDKRLGGHQSDGRHHGHVATALHIEDEAIHLLLHGQEAAVAVPEHELGGLRFRQIRGEVSGGGRGVGEGTRAVPAVDAEYSRSGALVWVGVVGS